MKNQTPNSNKAHIVFEDNINHNRRSTQKTDKDSILLPDKNFSIAGTSYINLKPQFGEAEMLGQDSLAHVDSIKSP